MNGLMICPKVGNPKDECISSGGCSPCIHKTPHNEMPSCIDEGKVCHHCIPHIREFKIGDKVRVPSGKEIYNICDTTFRDGFIRFVLKEHPIIDFRANELELIIEGDKIMNENKLKYKATGRELPLWKLIRDSEINQQEFNNLSNWLYNHKKRTGQYLKTDILTTPDIVEYAERSTCFMKYLTERGHIEKVEIKTDPWDYKSGIWVEVSWNDIDKFQPGVFVDRVYSGRHEVCRIVRKPYWSSFVNDKQLLSIDTNWKTSDIQRRQYLSDFFRGDRVLMRKT